MPAANTNQQPANYHPANPQPTLEDVAEYVHGHMGEWFAEKSFAKPRAVYEIELRERVVRVEEELKNQRELMKQGFDLIEKRLEIMARENDRRFDAMTQENDRRFGMIDKRFDDVNRRFDDVNKRFEDMNKRFEEINKRFETLAQRIDRFMIWSFGITIGSASLVIAALKWL